MSRQKAILALAAFFALCACSPGPRAAEQREPEPAARPLQAPAPIEPAPADASATVAKPIPELELVDRPIAFDEERTRLTIEYRKTHQDPSSDSIEIEPVLIVLHHTGGGSAESTWRYFNRTKIEGGRKKLQRASAVNVSAHFIVDRDGTILRLLPETHMARHTIGLNHLSIGVENVGDLETFPLTDAQLDANERLIRDLAARFPITHLIGHHEYRAMEGHAYFLELDPAYRNRKPDPGEAFMRKVRARVADLALEGPPPQAE